jgi:hypothetical protein
MSVGRIVQVHPLDATYHRGDEKFVFRFGGSVIVVFGEPGAWRANEDIVGHTREGIETSCGSAKLSTCGFNVGRLPHCVDAMPCCMLRLSPDVLVLWSCLEGRSS